MATDAETKELLPVAKALVVADKGLTVTPTAALGADTDTTVFGADDFKLRSNVP